MELNKIYLGDNIETLKSLPDASVDCCITSPPYYGLRDYGTGTWVGGDPDCPHYVTRKHDSTSTGHKSMAESAGALGAVGGEIYKSVCPKCGAVREDKQVGLEESPEEYIDRLVTIFREVKRVLKDEGTLWVNIGDSYNGYKGNANGEYFDSPYVGGHGFHPSREGGYGLECKNLKPKDLIGIPWMLAFALRKDGWYLRQDILWAKPNPMPESVKDRCTKSHEYIFLLSKSPKYYFDYKSIQEEAETKPHRRETWSPNVDIYDNSKYTDAEQESSVRQGMNKTRGEHILQLRKNLPTQAEFVEFMRQHTNVNALSDIMATPRTTIEHWFRSDNSGFSYPSIDEWEVVSAIVDDDSDEFHYIDSKMTEISYETDAIDKNSEGTRNKRDVWSVRPAHYKEAHFATFPEELVAPMVLAGCPKGGVVLDPFMGSGTTAVVAKNNGRNYIGCELNEEYVKMAENRISRQQIRLF